LIKQTNDRGGTIWNRTEPITSIIPSWFEYRRSPKAAIQHDTTTLFLEFFPSHWFIAKYIS
jgi:hypothetical protein